MSAERRKHTRFDVSNILTIKGVLSPASSACHLMTLSQGGCGFWCPDIQAEFNTSQMVQVSLSLDLVEPAQIEGELLYRYPHPFKGQLGQFIGIRFLAAEAKKVQPFLDELSHDAHSRPGKKAAH